MATLKATEPQSATSFCAVLQDLGIYLWPLPRQLLSRGWHLTKTYRVTVAIGATGVIACIVLACIPDVVCVPPTSGNHSDPAETCLNGQSYWMLSLNLVALLLMGNNAPADLVMLAFTIMLSVSGVITDDEAWQGFAEPSVLAIGALFVVARALEETRAVELFILPLLGEPTTHNTAIFRLALPVGLFSAFMNNTPIVAMLLSVVENWAVRCGLHAKVLLMPLSFASMLGGMCTLIGTSTNLVLNANINSDLNAPLEPFTMFSMTLVALPAALVGAVYLSLVAPRLLRPPAASSAAPPAAVAADAADEERPARPAGEASGHAAPVAPPASHMLGSFYSLEAHIGAGCALIGKPASELAALVSTSFCEPRLVFRGTAVHEVTADEPLLLKLDDSVLLRCMPEAIPPLRAVAGLRLRPEAASEALGGLAVGHCLVEAVVAHSSPLDGLSLHRALDTPVLGQTAMWGVRQRPHAGTPHTPLGGEGDFGWDDAPRLDAPRLVQHDSHHSSASGLGQSQREATDQNASRSPAAPGALPPARAKGETTAEAAVGAAAPPPSSAAEEKLKTTSSTREPPSAAPEDKHAPTATVDAASPNLPAFVPPVSTFSPYLTPAADASPALGASLGSPSLGGEPSPMPPLPGGLPSAVFRRPLDARPPRGRFDEISEVSEDPADGRHPLGHSLGHAEGAGQQRRRLGWTVMTADAHWCLVGDVFTECAADKPPALERSPSAAPSVLAIRPRSPVRSPKALRQRHGWALAVHDLRLRAGDILLLEAPVSWVQTHRTTHFWLLLGVVAKSERGACYGARYGACDPSDAVARRRERFNLAASLVCLLVLLILSATAVVGLLQLSVILAFILIGVVQARRRSLAPPCSHRPALPASPCLSRIRYPLSPLRAVHHARPGLALHLVPSSAHDRLLLWPRRGAHKHGRRRRARLLAQPARRSRSVVLPLCHLHGDRRPLLHHLQLGDGRRHVQRAQRRRRRWPRGGADDDGHDARRLLGLCHTHRLPDQPNGPRARALRVWRLCQGGRRAARRRRPVCCHLGALPPEPEVTIITRRNETKLKGE